jgi:acyl carrier protein
MELSHFVKLVANQFEETDALIFKSDTHFRELDEYSSIIGLSLIAMIDEEFNVQIKGVDIRNCVTIEDLFNKVISVNK